MWRLLEHAHPVLTEEGGAVLDERNGRWIYLTPSASAAVMGLCASTSLGEAAACHAGRFGIGLEQASSDVAAVAESLVGAGVAVDGAARGKGWRWWR